MHNIVATKLFFKKEHVFYRVEKHEAQSCVLQFKIAIQNIPPAIS